MTTHKCEYQKEIKETHCEVFGNGKPGLKYDYVKFKSKVEDRMVILMWLFGLQFAGTVALIGKSFLGGG